MPSFINYFKANWVLINPFIIYRAIRGFVRALLFRKNTLKTIEIFPSYHCNLKCTMCSQEKKYTKPEDTVLELGEYKRLAKDGVRLGAIAVQILGGEPLVNKNLNEIIRIFKEEHYFVYMVSNGLLANYDVLKSLKQSGLDSICFSLDSTEESVCDDIRGIDGYRNKVFLAVDNAKKAGLDVKLSPVFFHGHLDDSFKVIEYCKENNIGASGTQMAPVGAAENSETLTPEENQRIHKLVDYYSSFTLDWTLSYFLKPRCPAGKEKIAITAYGDVIGCSINPIGFGNIRKEPLSVIHERMGKFSHFSKDFSGCLSAENPEYIRNIIRPMKNFTHYPVSYQEHPNTTIEKEREIHQSVGFPDL